MADETTNAPPAADATAVPTGESSSPSSADIPASSGTAASDSSTSTSPSSSSDTATETTPSLISTADADKASATEIGDKAPEAETAKPDTASTEAAEDKAAGDKPAAPEADKPAADAAPADKAPADAPQAPREYEAFKVPEGITLAQKETKEFTDVLEDGKLTHQERAQKLVDLYVREAQRFTSELKTQQQKAWNDFTDGLKADFKADPELGGNRQDTTLGIAKAVIERFGGDDAQKSDLYAMLDHTGMGNHRGLVRVLNNVFEAYMREASAVPGNPPNLRNGQSRQDAFYG